MVDLLVRSEQDIYLALHHAKKLMNQFPFSDMDKQKVFVCISELLRNVLDHANGLGHFSCYVKERKLYIMVTDQGSGIGNLEEALQGKKNLLSQGLGLGLSGAKRLMDEFYIESSTGGTKIIASKWINHAGNRKEGKRTDS